MKNDFIRCKELLQVLTRNSDYNNKIIYEMIDYVNIIINQNYFEKKICIFSKSYFHQKQ